MTDSKTNEQTNRQTQHDGIMHGQNYIPVLLSGELEYRVSAIVYIKHFIISISFNVIILSFINI